MTSNSVSAAAAGGVESKEAFLRRLSGNHDRATECIATAKEMTSRVQSSTDDEMYIKLFTQIRDLIDKTTALALSPEDIARIERLASQSSEEAERTAMKTVIIAQQTLNDESRNLLAILRTANEARKT